MFTTATLAVENARPRVVWAAVVTERRGLREPRVVLPRHRELEVVPDRIRELRLRLRLTRPRPRSTLQNVVWGALPRTGVTAAPTAPPTPGISGVPQLLMSVLPKETPPCSRPPLPKRQFAVTSTPW